MVSIQVVEPGESRRSAALPSEPLRQVRVIAKFGYIHLIGTRYAADPVLRSNLIGYELRATYYALRTYWPRDRLLSCGTITPSLQYLKNCLTMPKTQHSPPLHNHPATNRNSSSSSLPADNTSRQSARNKRQRSNTDSAFGRTLLQSVFSGPNQ